MKIKYKRLIIITALIPIIGLIYIFSVNYPLREISPKTKIEVPLDTIIPKLPKDPVQAKKELQRVQKALASLRPKGLYIVIDTHSNLLYLRTADSILLRATCSTGYGGELIDSITGKKWVFNTPKGVFKVNSKLVEPWWRKPDWAFIEEGEEIPKDPNERYDPYMLGEYALGFGNGYFIHGTLYTRLLGVSVSHGCVRLGSEDLEFLYKKVSIGTPVYVI